MMIGISSEIKAIAMLKYFTEEPFSLNKGVALISVFAMPEISKCWSGCWGKNTFSDLM